MQGMDEFEIESRVYGRPAALAKNPVFDRKILYEMREKCADPMRGEFACSTPLHEVTETTPMVFKADPTGALRIWEFPKPGEQYILGVDTAAGLRNQDASCTSVVKVLMEGGRLRLDMVAQYHGWLGLFDYADAIFKLAVAYNCGLVVIELTGGLGRGVLERLKGSKAGDGLCYWNIFRDTQKGEFVQFRQDERFGLDTTPYSKPSMIGALQQLIKDHGLRVKCRDTISELVAFAQEMTDMGNPRYRGAGGTHDDRVMSLVLAAYVAMTYPVLDFDLDAKKGVQAAYSDGGVE
jgi:hypothetical protein